MTDYLERNVSYYSQGYSAPNVDHPVFRFYGRILVPDFGLDGSNGERVLDFGCGEGAAVKFFAEKGFDAYGVDISGPDLESARRHYPELEDHFQEVPARPDPEGTFFGGEFDVIITIQTIYLLSDTDMEAALKSLERQLVPGGIFYATMMTPQHYYAEHSKPAEDGLSEVNYSNKRLTVSNFFVNVTEDEEHLKRRFHMFEPLHIGFYAQRFRDDEGPGHHLTFVGRKPA